MNYNEFFFWVSGFITNKRVTDITQEDLDLIKSKIKEVESKDTVDDFISRLYPKGSPTEPIKIKDREDDI